MLRRADGRPLLSGALLAASLAWLSWPRPGAAQPPLPPAAPPTAVAGRAARPPVVDGDVLGDPVWAAPAPDVLGRLKQVVADVVSASFGSLP